jgi:hypothetical protein
MTVSITKEKKGLKNLEHLIGEDSLANLGKTSLMMHPKQDHDIMPGINASDSSKFKIKPVSISQVLNSLQVFKEYQAKRSGVPVKSEDGPEKEYPDSRLEVLTKA